MSASQILLGILEDVATIYDDMKGKVELPQPLRETADRVPLVLRKLGNVQARAKSATETTINEIAPLVESCNKNAVRLRTILRNLELDKSTPALDLYFSTIRGWGDPSMTTSAFEGSVLISCQRLWTARGFTGA
jgi:N-terminal domain on NACHT_NTPase and P-loop NTPases